MFFLLGKLSTLLLSPFNWFVLAMAVAAWKSKPHWRGWLFGVWGLLVVLSNPGLVQLASRSWEIRDCQKPVKPNAYDAIVVLGGGFVYSNDSAGDDVHLGETADRMFQAFRLFRSGAAPRILVSGGPAPLPGGPPAEATLARQALLSLGVPDSAILVEARSRTTWENAKETAALVEKNPELFPRKRVLLVTSAVHLRRALWCFRHWGLSVTPYACDFHEAGAPPAGLFDWFLANLPCPWVLRAWDSLAHEWMGLVAYRLHYGSA